LEPLNADDAFVAVAIVPVPRWREINAVVRSGTRGRSLLGGSASAVEVGEHERFDSYSSGM
jgi:hypothetical protein